MSGQTLQKKLIKQAKTAVLKAGVHAYRDRRNKKRTRRALWQVKISAFVKEHDLSYSKFIDLLKKAGVSVDRKILADLAENHPKAFESILNKLKK